MIELTDSCANARKDIRENYARLELVSNKVEGFKTEIQLMLKRAGMEIFIQLTTLGDILQTHSHLRY